MSKEGSLTHRTSNQAGEKTHHIWCEDSTVSDKRRHAQNVLETQRRNLAQQKGVIAGKRPAEVAESAENEVEQENKTREDLA